MGTDAICKYLPLVGLSYVKVCMLFLPEHDYVVFGFLLLQIRLSSVACNVRAPYSEG